MSSRNRAKAAAAAAPQGPDGGDGAPRYLTRSAKKRLLSKPDVKEEAGNNKARGKPAAATAAKKEADEVKDDVGMTDVQQARLCTPVTPERKNRLQVAQG